MPTTQNQLVTKLNQKQHLTPPNKRTSLSIAIALASCTNFAYALDFNLGAVEGNVASNLSIGASIGTAGPNLDLIGANNGGRGLSSATDDGRLNFKQGKPFSQIFKGNHELELKYQNAGLFMRGNYWYDAELKDGTRPFKQINDKNAKNATKSAGGQILDAFAYYSYTLGNQPGKVRLGQQVLNWGESTFIQNGINASNPMDLAAFRRPGSELKEVLIPVNMFNIAQNITTDLAVEAFYQLKWDQTVVENCSTFFGGDMIAKGCNNNMAVLLSKKRFIPFLTSQGTPEAIAQGAMAGLEGLGVKWGNPDEGVILPRLANIAPKDDGQWGAAVSYMVASLDTEFSLFFVNYHSRVPFFNVKAPNALDEAIWQAAVTGGMPNELAPFYRVAKSSYFMAYPENIRLYGLSFATTLPSGTAWSGELSYRPNLPIQINTTDLVYSVVAPGLNAIEGVNAGDVVTGFKRKEVSQLQTTFTHIFDNVLGADSVAVIGEIGFVHVGNLSKDKLRYGRDADFGPGALKFGKCEQFNSIALAGVDQKNVKRYCNNNGFTTRDSVGYRLATQLRYSDVFASINLIPKLSFNHDVKGYSPEPAANFIAGRKAINIGVDAEYGSGNFNYVASISYSNFFGGTYNNLIDRDFASLSFGIHF